MSFAFVFPGQGSQSVGMMAAYGDAAVVRATFDEASAALGDDLWGMVSEGPAEILTQTVNTQPVMLTAGIAAWRLWLEKGGRQPTVVAGHSLGEYSALVAAGVIDLKDAVPLVRLRAAAMQEAVPVGNGAMEACKARGAKMTKALPVSAPFHSSLIRPAADKLATRLAELTLSTPQIPVINNVDVAIENDPSRIKNALIRQAYNPVRWVETIQSMATLGIDTVAECGPGKVLAGLTKRCADGIVGVALADAASIEANLGLE